MLKDSKSCTRFSPLVFPADLLLFKKYPTQTAATKAITIGTIVIVDDDVSDDEDPATNGKEKRSAKIAVLSCLSRLGLLLSLALGI